MRCGAILALNCSIGCGQPTIGDPAEAPPLPSADPGDDYLIALAAGQRAVLVSGDVHLTSLVDRLPIRTPAEFLNQLPPWGGNVCPAMSASRAEVT